MKTSLLLILSLAFYSAFSQIDSLKKKYGLGIEAYEERRFDDFLSHMQQADACRELYPPVIYNLAAGYALNGDTEQAVRYLKTYLTMNSSVNFQEDTDFDGIKNTEGFQSAIALADKLNSRVITSRPFRIIADLEHAESVGINPIDETIFVGDVRARKVYSFDGEEITALLSLNNHPDFFGVTGLEFDSKTEKLWICTTMLPQSRDYTEMLDGFSSVFSYDINFGTLNHIGTLSGNSNFGDLTVSKKSEVYISDGTSNKIYTVENGSLSVFLDLSDKALNLQGLTLSEDQQTLFVADYVLGMFAINLKTKDFKRLAFAEGVPFKGIDGLYCYRNTFYALQNGTTPMRVIQLFFDPETNTIYDYAPYDQSAPYLNEPTQGVLTKTHFVYISNSPWGAYDENGQLTENKPLILRKIILK